MSRPTSSDREPAPAGRTDGPPNVPHRLAAQIGFIVEVDRLKTVLRRSPLIAAARRENDAEHSWHLALMVTVLAEYSDTPLDVGRTTQLVLLHDLVEIYAGDTFLYDDAAAADQEVREQAAADRLFALLPDDQAARFRALWDEFEARRTPEARFAKAMDRLQPLLANFYNQGGTWATPGITSAVERHHMAVIGDASTPLWDYAQQLIEHATDRGWIAAGQTP
jgi:putative hydrolase of HD superfamily